MANQPDRSSSDLLDRWGLALLLFLGAFSLGGMVLAALGRFVLPLLVLWVGVSALLATLGGRGAGGGVALGRGAGLSFLGVVLLSGLAFFPGAEFILGGWDAGLYYATGLDLARYGAFAFPDRYASLGLAGFSEAFIAPNPGLQPYLVPGYAVAGEGEIFPQFSMLLSLLVGALALLGEPRLALLTAPFVGVLSIAFFWLLVRRMRDERAATLAAVFLALNGVQMWHARQTLSEELVQVMLFGGMWAGLCYLDKRSWPYALATGISLGILPLVKTEGLVLSLLVIGAFSFLLWRSPSPEGSRWLAFSAVGSLLFSLLHYATTARFYVRDQLLWGATGYVLLALVLLGAGILAALVQSRRRGRSPLSLLRWDPVRLSSIAPVALFAWAGAAALGGGLLAPLEMTQALWLGSYLSPWEVALLGGCALWLVGGRKWAVGRSLPVPLLWALGLGSVLYLAIYFRYASAQETLPTFMWATRRLVPLVLPGLALAEAAAVLAVAKAWPWRGAALLPALLAIVLLATRLPDTLVIFLHREYEGAVAQIGALAQDLGNPAVVLLEGDDVGLRLSTPLRSLYGLPTYVLWHPEQSGPGVASLVRAAQERGETVYYAATTPGPGARSLASYQMSFVADYQLRLPELERVSGRRPAQANPFVASFALFRLEEDRSKSVAAFPVLVDVGREESFTSYALLGEGFYGAEVMPDGTTYRWTGERALFLLPEGDGGDLLLRVRVMGERPQELGPAEVAVFCRKQALARFSVGASFEIHSFVVPTACRAGAETEVRLEMAGWSPRQRGMSPDDRVLGVKVDWIAVGQATSQ